MSADISFLSKSLMRDAQRVHADNKIIMYRDKIPIKVDYDKGVLIAQGREIPIIVDGDFKITDPSTKGWVNLSYDRFEVHIDEDFYSGKEAEFNLFFDRFEPRYELMELLTGWSSEKFYGEKLEIYVESSGTTCWAGYASPGEAHLGLTSWFGNPDVCKAPYFVDGVPYYDNPGELGDQWMYMSGALHESLHAINPLPIFWRAWFTEGWSQYYEFNVLSDSMFNDINQETADYYIYNANFSTTWGSWNEYVANDYKDKLNKEIQESSGYDITAWMLSMLRDDHSLPWENFYEIVDNNPETLDESFSKGDYYTDTHVIDLFERATGIEMYPVFRYDGPGGPGWGVRQWESLDWYADLTPSLQLSDTIQVPEATVSLDAVIYNNGDVSLRDVPVRFYSNDSLISEQTTDVDSDSFAVANAEYTASEGTYEIRVVVDEDNIKIETDDSNNQDSATVSFTAIRGDANGNGAIEPADVVYLINYLFRNGPAPDPLNAGDCNCDGSVAPGDVVYLINYLFRNGPPPSC
jgi:hypothetical protein